MQVLTRPPSGWPALVLNADFRPLSYYPLSLWPWQDTIKAVFLERVEVVSTYDQVVRSPSFEMALPSVVALKSYVAQDRSPAFTRFNLFLRDAFSCQYCGAGEELTFDHVIPRSRGGRTSWENIVTACAPCNLRKGGRTPKEAQMPPGRPARRPTTYELQGPRPPLPAEPPASKLDGLPVLGHRVGGVMKGVTSAAWGAVALALIAAAPRKVAPVQEEAKGRFEVQMKPLDSPDPAIGRMSISKRFHGDLEATSIGEMLSAGSPPTGSAGYVAIELVTGSLRGRMGSFALQHGGVMDAGAGRLDVVVSPGSGTGALKGIAGSMTIDVAADHAYLLRYTLPADPPGQ